MLVVEVLSDEPSIDFLTYVSEQALLWKAVNCKHCSLMANSALYLIFAVSSQTLHLRFCCNNTGKRNLRKQCFCQRHYRFTCKQMLTCEFNMHFMPSRKKKCPGYNIWSMNSLFFKRWSAFMNELHDVRCMICWLFKKWRYPEKVVA